MSAVAIPLLSVPAQDLSIRLGQQSCRFRVYQKRTGLYLDIYVNDALLLAGILCRDRVWLVRSPASGFVGDLSFMDTQGQSDPEYSALGSRYELIWVG